jgi:hypothetical protein
MMTDEMYWYYGYFVIKIALVEQCGSLLSVFIGLVDLSVEDLIKIGKLSVVKDD